MYLIHECHSPSAKPQALSGCHQRLQLFLQVTQCNAQHLRFLFQRLGLGKSTLVGNRNHLPEQVPAEDPEFV